LKKGISVSLKNLNPTEDDCYEEISDEMVTLNSEVAE